MSRELESKNIEMQPTVFVVDDDAAVRNAIAVLLTASGMQMQLFKSAEEFIRVYNPAWPGCLILDLQLPGMKGLELQRLFSKKGIELPVIIITGHGSVAASVESMKLAAVDFIEKPFREKVLLESIQKAIARDTQIRSRKAQQADFLERLRLLSDRERQVLDLLVAGESDKKIALQLGITQRGVSFHRSNIFTKMQVSSTVELVNLTNKARYSAPS